MLKTNPAESKALSEIRADAENGTSISDSVSKLYHLGISISASIHIIKRVYGVSLAKAKASVAGHSVWKSFADVAKPYYDELINHLGELNEAEDEKISSYEIYIHKQIRHAEN